MLWADSSVKPLTGRPQCKVGIIKYSNNFSLVQMLNCISILRYVLARPVRRSINSFPKVEALTRKLNKWVVATTDGKSHTYDSVILATPFHSSGIAITPPPRFPIPEQPYVHLHVTLLSTSSPTPNPIYYSLQSDAIAPTMVLTTNDGNDGSSHGGPAPEFNSLTYHGKISGHNGRPDEYLVKIFSAKKIEDTWLQNMFGKVGWVFRKEVSGDHMIYLTFVC